MRRVAAFSLVEVLVAAGVMVAVFVPLMFVFTQTVRQAEVSLDEVQATALADELLDQLAAVPCVKNFQTLIAFPAPNPPPAYSRWATLATTGTDFPAAAVGFTANLDTGGWVKTGACYAGTDMPPDLQPYARLFPSSCAPRFRREYKVHRALDRPSSLDESDALAEIEVRVSWDDQFVSGPHTRRELALRALVADPRMPGASR
jgi:type II secretory pathway pseudopilin PulG